MKVLVITLGTRGDVDPYVALGKGLRSAGHHVTVCTSCSFEPLVAGHGLAYGYMNDDIPKLVRSEEGRRMIDTTAGLWQWVKAARKLAKLSADMHRRMLDDGWQSAQEASPDLVVYHPKAFGAPHFAEALGVPAAAAVAMPLLVPTAEFPCIGFPGWRLGRRYNRLTYSLFRRLMALSFGKSVREWRAAHGLPPPGRRTDPLLTASGEPVPVLHGYSRHVLPRPPDWPQSAAVTGYWFLGEDTAWQPPQRLRRFLDAGDPPVYVGFGSMAGGDPQGRAQVVVEALRQAKVRGIIAAGWGGLSAGNLPDTVLAVDDVPHDWLFPRTAAVVHHGGAGTTAAGLRAGRPAVVCPFIGDQPFWGRRLQDLGVGAAPIPQKAITAGRLAAGIRAVTTDPAYRRNAEALGEKIRSEDGVANAVATLEAIGRSRPGGAMTRRWPPAAETRARQDTIPDGGSGVD